MNIKWWELYCYNLLLNLWCAFTFHNETVLLSPYGIFVSSFSIQYFSRWSLKCSESGVTFSMTWTNKYLLSHLPIFIEIEVTVSAQPTKSIIPKVVSSVHWPILVLLCVFLYNGVTLYSNCGNDVCITIIIIVEQSIIQIVLHSSKFSKIKTRPQGWLSTWSPACVAKMGEKIRKCNKIMHTKGALDVKINVCTVCSLMTLMRRWIVQ